MDSLISSTILAQNSGGGGGAIVGCMFGLIALALLVVVIAGAWKMFVKAGHPGWAAIVPFYNYYIMCKIGGRPGWWLLLMLIPYVGFIFQIIVHVDVSKSFGKSLGFHIGMALLAPIFICILGFGDAEYQGPAAG